MEPQLAYIAADGLRPSQILTTFPTGKFDFLFDFAPVVAVGVPVCASVGAVTAAAVAAAAAPNFDLFIILNCSKDEF